MSRNSGRIPAACPRLVSVSSRTDFLPWPPRIISAIGSPARADYSNRRKDVGRAAPAAHLDVSETGRIDARLERWKQVLGADVQALERRLASCGLNDRAARLARAAASFAGCAATRLGLVARRMLSCDDARAAGRHRATFRSRRADAVSRSPRAVLACGATAAVRPLRHGLRAAFRDGSRLAAAPLAGGAGADFLAGFRD